MSPWRPFALRAARARRWIEGHWAQVVPVVGAAGPFGIADARGGSGFIAAFVGGLVFEFVVNEDTAPAAFAEGLGGVLNGLTLIVFGAAVLGSVWSDIGIAQVGYAVLSLTVVRMIPVAVAMLGSGAQAATVLFLGWFDRAGWPRPCSV